MKLSTKAGVRVLFLTLAASLGLAQTAWKTPAAPWWTVDLHLTTLSEIPEALSAPILRGGKPTQVTLVRGTRQRVASTCKEYLSAVAQKFAPYDDKGGETPFVERCYPLTYLRRAQAATESFVEPHWGPDALRRLPPFDLFVEASLAARAAEARARGVSWQEYDPTMRVVSTSDRNLILENDTVRWSLALVSLADINRDGLNDAVVIACDSKKTTGGGICFPMVLTVRSPGAAYRLLNGTSPPYRLSQ